MIKKKKKITSYVFYIHFKIIIININNGLNYYGNCTDYSTSLRPEICIKKVNNVNFDFMLTVHNHHIFDFSSFAIFRN